MTTQPEKILAHFREQAFFCDSFGSPFTARLIEAMAADFERRGPVFDLIGAWSTNPRADALSLRLAGALHHAALESRSGLAAFYPPNAWSMDALWPAARDLLARESAWARAFIASPPQTNETRRSIVLLPGFLAAASRFDGAFETLELGASAGLNLHWDKFAYRTATWSWNEAGAPQFDTDWQGPAPQTGARIAVRARAACDQNPLDVANGADRLRLKSYIWPDQPERIARFDAAADLAVRERVNVEKADAGAWIEQKLAHRARDAATIVYHSIFYQYPPRETRARIRAAIEAAGASATPEAPLFWLRMEPEALFGGPIDSVRIFVDLVSWPGGERRVLLETDGHARWARAEV